MQVTAKSRFQVRLQNILFVGLFLAVIGLLGWLTTRYTWQADWTAGGRNTLSESSVKLLHTLSDPVNITAYAREDDVLRGRIRDLVGRYQREKPDISLNFINPDAAPQQVREMGITVDGELLIDYQGRSEQIQSLNEQSLSNALQRVALSSERWIVFLEGHGERKPGGIANHDLGDWSQELERKGLKVQTVNLARTPAIPENTAVLVIASPQVDYLPGETRLIRDYLDQGGNLLWLGEPDAAHGLEPLAEALGVTFLPGVIVDANTQLFGIQNPAFALVADYPNHPIFNDFAVLTLFPIAAALDYQAPEGWDTTPLLSTLPRSWTETGALEGEIQYNEGTEERAGPLTLGLALTRELKEEKSKPSEDGSEEPAPDEPPPREQRVVVIGDGDFLSNAYLGNGGNLDLGLNLIHWLAHDDRFIAIRVKPAPDLTLSLSNTASAVISVGFLLALPLGLLVTGFVIWYRRRQR